MKTLILSLCLSLIASICFAQGSTGSSAVPSYSSSGSSLSAASYGSSGASPSMKSGGSTGASYAVTPVKVQLVAARTPIRSAIQNAKSRRENRKAAVAAVAVPVPVQTMQAAGCTCVDCQCNTQVQQAVPSAPVSIAQAKAESLAASGRLSHAGPLAGSREGVGFSTRSAQDAIANCCFAGRLQAKDVGVARGRDGWYAVQGY